ncbi:aldolase [Canariomyces notabilis]|uniref:Aldolase n=1 Tax=Canariomyces notabilis TaxID=2074819 RepID=A0AAN6TLA2_9PEZI|nr:aldolase [Canariomyces arenarius]
MESTPSLTMPITPVSISHSGLEPDATQDPALPLTRLPNGVYVPMLAFFTAADQIDVPAIQRHTARLLAAGVAGLVVHGSNGEAVHMSRRERRTVIEAVVDAVRHTADSLHAPVPIIAGCAASSVRETVALCCEAREAGATHALVLPPGYYAGIISKAEIVGYFHAVADRSPIPILVYNFPAAANGLDLDSDVILRIAEHPKVVGVKLTCGNTGKLARLVADVPKLPGRREGDFLVAGGSADFILQGLVAGGHATISGFANLAPRACVRICELFEQGRLQEARELQLEVARADWLAIRYGFVGVKAAMPFFHGQGEVSCVEPRLPFKRLEEDDEAVREIQRGMAGVLAIEERLAAGTDDTTVADGHPKYTSMLQ